MIAMPGLVLFYVLVQLEGKAIYDLHFCHTRIAKTCQS